MECKGYTSVCVWGGRGVKVNGAKCRGTLRCKNSLCGVKVHSL